MSAFTSHPNEHLAIKNRARVRSLTAKGDQRQFVKHNYTDHSHDLGDVNYAKRYNLVGYEGENTSSEQRHITVTLSSPTFPLKLHMILDKIEDSDSDMKNGISWLPHGRAFHIRNADIFKREILAKYFKNCKVSSFYRQINLYGFIRLTTGCETGAYYHEYFLRGRAFLTKHIVRTKVKGTKIRPTSAPKDEPNFYAMAPVGPMQQPMEMPLGVVSSNSQLETSAALLAAIREVEQINYANAESQNLRYNIPQNAIQNTYLGGIASPQASVSHLSPLSLYNLDGYLANNLRLPYTGTPGTVYHDMTRAATLQNELSRNALQNEMSQVATHAEMTRAAVQNELSRTVIQNEILRSALARDGHNEIPRMAQPF